MEVPLPVINSCRLCGIERSGSSMIVTKPPQRIKDLILCVCVFFLHFRCCTAKIYTEETAVSRYRDVFIFNHSREGRTRSILGYGENEFFKYNTHTTRDNREAIVLRSVVGRVCCTNEGGQNSGARILARNSVSSNARACPK